MEKEISNALGHGPPDEILSSAFKLRITRGDIQTLKNYHWLNDEVSPPPFLHCLSLCVVSAVCSQGYFGLVGRGWESNFNFCSAVFSFSARD